MFTLSLSPGFKCGDRSDPFYKNGGTRASGIPHTAVWGSFKSFLREDTLANSGALRARGVEDGSLV